MAPPDKQHPNGLVGPFALYAEKVGLGVFAAMFVVILFVLAVLQPEDPTFLYVLLVLNVALFVVSAMRLHRMLRQTEQD